MLFMLICILYSQMKYIKLIMSPDFFVVRNKFVCFKINMWRLKTFQS